MADTSVGLPENVAGALCYILGVISGIIFLVVEKKNQTVRFHAMQSVVFFGGLWVIKIALGFVPFLGGLLSALLGLASFVAWIFLMYKAFTGERYVIPTIGEFAEKQLK